MFRFTIRELLLSMLWVGVLCTLLLAMGKIYADSGDPWYVDRQKLWSLTLIHLGIGASLGGIVGFLLHSSWSAPLIGLTLGLIADACFTIWLANAAAGLA